MLCINASFMQVHIYVFTLNKNVDLGESVEFSTGTPMTLVLVRL
jgi:hypothetical protein